MTFTPSFKKVERLSTKKWLTANMFLVGFGLELQTDSNSEAFLIFCTLHTEETPVHAVAARRFGAN